MACPQACVPAGVPAGVVCPKRRDTEEPDGRVVGPEGGMVRESMRDVPEGDTKEPEREIGRWARSPPPRMTNG